jgi:hypothetical protein
MNNKFRIKEKLCLLSGEDTTIIFQMNDKLIINYFTIIGAFVFMLFMLVLTSTIMLYLEIFQDSILLDILIGVFWAFAITNIYVLLLYTITPTIHPNKYKKGNKIVMTNTLVNDNHHVKLYTENIGSFIFKIAFITIITASTTVPLYYNFIYKLRPNVYKGEHFINKNTKIDYTDNLNTSSKLSNINKEIKKATLINCINDSIKDRFFWIFNIVVLFLLTIPIILKYLLRGIGALTNKETFYHRKQKLEKRLINKQYKLFKNHYETLLKKNDDYWRNRIKNNIEPYLKQLDKYNIDDANFLRNKIENDLTPQTFERYEAWEDSPFNIIKKEDALSFKTENDLILKLYEVK